MILENFNSNVEAAASIKGGAQRNLFKVLYENLVDDICYQKTNNTSFVGDSDLIINKFGIKTQVDRHIYKNSKDSVALFVECKAYLDACFLKRAISDFLQLSLSDKVSDNTKYLILAGQSAIKDETKMNYENFAKVMYNIEVEILFVSDIRRNKDVLTRKTNEDQMNKIYEYFQSI